MNLHVLSCSGAEEFFAEGGKTVEERQLKKLLAGLCISGLVAGSSLAAPVGAQEKSS
jgi:radical SAM modification target selenobiotic family peptide